MTGENTGSRSVAMRDIVAFHPTARGSAVVSVSGRADLVERRPEVPGGAGGGLVFSARPLKPRQRVCVELVRGRRRLRGGPGAPGDGDRRQVPGSARLGFSRHDPATVAATLPPFAVPDLTDCDGFWARVVGAGAGRVTVWLDDDGVARWNVDGRDRGVLVDGLPVDVPLWLLVDLYGPVTGARLVPPGTNPSMQLVVKRN